MSRLVFLFCLLLTVTAAPAAAEKHNHAVGDLAGNWVSHGSTGVFTQLEIQDNGRFVFRQLHSADLRRSYKCGHLTDAGSTLDLEVQQQKERSAQGEIAQASGMHSERIVVKSRTANTLVVTIDARTVVLERNGSA